MMQHDLPLAGRRALVTGSAQGIGRAIAERLASDGAEVIIADLNAELARTTAEEIGRRGRTAMAGALDVANPESVTALAETAGEVDILVNNAGIYQKTPIIGTPEAVWAKGLDINLNGTIRCIQAFAPGMVARGWGRIVNLGSIASYSAFGEDISYVASKTAVLGVTRSAAMDLAPHGVTVNAIAPGNINTEMMASVGQSVEEREGLAPGSFLKSRAAAIPVRRLGEPRDIAAAVAFLCREDAAYVTGEVLNVNGALFFF